MLLLMRCSGGDDGGDRRSYEVIDWLALDIGGTLAKVACVEDRIPGEASLVVFTD